MSGSLIKIDEEVLSGTVSSVTLLGIDTTYEVYKVVISNAQVTTDESDVKIRFTESDTPNTTANYDSAHYHLNSQQAFNTQTETNSTSMDLSLNIGNDTGEAFNSVVYIFNAPNSSEFTFITCENTILSKTAELRGKQGGGVFTVTSAVNGIQFIESMDTGTFTLYGLKK